MVCPCCLLFPTAVLDVERYYHDRRRRGHRLRHRRHQTSDLSVKLWPSSLSHPPSVFAIMCSSLIVLLLTSPANKNHCCYVVEGLLMPPLPSSSLSWSTTESSASTMKTTTTSLFLAKATKNKKTKKNAVSGSSGGGLKGFGSPVTVSPATGGGGGGGGVRVEVDRSRDARDFYDYLDKSDNAGGNLKRCALGNFQVSDGVELRGVVALRPIKKGDDIINIPYELAINLGQEGADPTIPALNFLKDYCATLSSASASASSSSKEQQNHHRAAYYRMLPPFLGDDCLGSTDFFSDRALDELQSPLIKEETLNRRKLVQSRFEVQFGTDIGPSASTKSKHDDFTWIDGTPITHQHLLWAVWLITSRVLTVQGQEGTGQSFRLLIPFLDMCNHDRSSPHILTGRAVPGGELKVVAGASVKEGDAINIVYGGGNAGNNRFIQDYGFLDMENDGDGGTAPAGFVMVAEELLGKRRVVEGASANRFLSQADRTRSLDALKATSISQDERLLAEETDPSVIVAFKYRLGVKRALSKLGAFDVF